MHLLFLGVVKACRELTTTWITESKRVNGYKSYSKGLLKPIADMGLDWLKVMTINSGWVSDNYLAFSRLSKWYYSPFQYMEEEVYVEPDLPVDRWLSEMCKSWLHAHGHGTNGYIAELKAKIKDLKSDVENPPEVKVVGGCSVYSLHQFIGSQLSMIASIMSRTVSVDILSRFDRGSKIFLTSLYLV